MNRGGSEEREGGGIEEGERKEPWRNLAENTIPNFRSYVLGRGCGGAGGGREKVALPRVCSQALAESFPRAAECPDCHTKKNLVLSELPGPAGVKPLNRPCHVTQHKGVKVAVRIRVTGVQLPRSLLPAHHQPHPCQIWGANPTASLGELGWLLERSRGVSPQLAHLSYRR